MRVLISWTFVSLTVAANFVRSRNGYRKPRHFNLFLNGSFSIDRQSESFSSIFSLLRKTNQILSSEMEEVLPNFFQSPTLCSVTSKSFILESCLVLYVVSGYKLLLLMRQVTVEFREKFIFKLKTPKKKQVPMKRN